MKTDIQNPYRLLLVDDEADYIDVLSKRLVKRGLEVTKAYNGSEGMRKLREQSFDLAVIDLKMEGMNGIEVLRLFKQMDPHIQVIMLTGHGSMKAAKEAIELGAFDYLSKPCDIEQLIGKINDACDGR